MVFGQSSKLTRLECCGESEFLLIFLWKSSFVSFSNPGETGIFDVVFIRRVIFLPSLSIRYKMFLAQSLLMDMGQPFSVSKELSFAKSIPFGTEFITDADTGAPLKRRAATVSIVFFISSSGNKVGLPIFVS